MILKLWCAQCKNPCYVEKHYETPEELEEFRTGQYFGD